MFVAFFPFTRLDTLEYCIIILYLKHLNNCCRLVLNSLLNPNLPVGEGVFDPEAEVEDQVSEYRSRGRGRGSSEGVFDLEADVEDQVRESLV
jgi:hypothetical protein